MSGSEAIAVLAAAERDPDDLAGDWQRRLRWTGLDPGAREKIVQVENSILGVHEKAGRDFVRRLMDLYRERGYLQPEDLEREIASSLQSVLDDHEQDYRRGYHDIETRARDHAITRTGQDPVRVRTARLASACEQMRAGISQVADVYPDRISENLSGSLNRVRSLPADVTDRLRENLSKGAMEGTTTEQTLRSMIGDALDRLDISDPAQMKDAIKQVWTKTKSDLQRVIRTETINAYSKAQLQEWWDMGIRQVTRHFIGDGRACAICRELGRPGNNVYEIAALLPLEHPVTEDPNNPGQFLTHPNCYLPGTVVRGQFVAGSRAFYDGPIVNLVTGDGRRLSVTPNHPVMTDHGLVAAKDLRPADNLLCYSSEIRVAGLDVAAHADHEQEPSLIEDVFAAISVRGVSADPANAHPDDFHGDAAYMIGDVHRVRANRVLLAERTTISDEGEDGILKPVAVVASDPVCERTPAPLGLRVLSPASGSMGGIRLTESGVPVHRGPLETFSVGVPADLDAALRQLVVDEPSGDRKITSEMLCRFSGQVALDHLVDVNVTHYSGHVYDLQSTTGLMVAGCGGIYASNCRDWFEPVLEDVWADFDSLEKELFIDMEGPAARALDVPIDSQDSVERILREVQIEQDFQFVPDIALTDAWQQNRLEELLAEDPDTARRRMEGEVQAGGILHWTDPVTGVTYISDDARYGTWVTLPFARRAGQWEWETAGADKAWWRRAHRKRIEESRKSLVLDGVEVFGGAPFFSPLAAESPEAYFTEAFAYYMVSPVVLQTMDSAAYNQLRDNVFSGTEYVTVGGVR